MVIHEDNFCNPPLNLPPLFLTGYNNACRDRRFHGPLPAPDPVQGAYLPIRWHTNTQERAWLALKTAIRSTHSRRYIDAHIG